MAMQVADDVVDGLQQAFDDPEHGGERAARGCAAFGLAKCGGQELEKRVDVHRVVSDAASMPPDGAHVELVAAGAGETVRV